MGMLWLPGGVGPEKATPKASPKHMQKGLTTAAKNRPQNSFTATPDISEDRVPCPQLNSYFSQSFG